MAFKLGIYHYNYNSSSDTSTDSVVDKSSWKFSGEFGINLDRLTPHVGISYMTNSKLGYDEFCYKETDGEVTDTRIACFALDGGLGIALSEGDLEQTLDLDLALPIYIDGPDTEDQGYVGLNFAPYYTVKCAVSDKLSLGAKLGLPFGFQFGDTFAFNLKPSVDAGLSYKATEKFTWNSGVKFAIVGFSYTSDDDADTSTFEVDGNDGSVSLSSGFNFAFNEKVSLDFNWNILNAIFGNNFTSDFNTGYTSDAFWGNINTFFKPQFGFIVVMNL